MKRLTAFVLCASFAFVTALLVLPGECEAYTIASGFTKSCHEEMTVRTILALDFQDELLPQGVPIPKSDSWRKLSHSMAEDNSVELESEEQRLVVFSILLGVRSPDTEGHSVTNLDTLRDAHTNPAGQYPHFLRSTLDDRESGDVSAIEGSVEHFRNHAQLAVAYLDFPREFQLIETSIYLDFYGQVDVEVWAPAFHLGIAIHALQDSFSHTVRSDDLHTIYHVMNFIEAVNTDHYEPRDGMAHSDAMDDCQDEAKEISETAEQATEELLIVINGGLASGDAPDLDPFINRWFSYREGCVAENNFCDSKWAPLARQDPTEPFLADILECSQGLPASKRPWGMLILLPLLVLAVRRHANRA